MHKVFTIVLVFLVQSAKAQALDYPREIFNTGETVTGTKPFPSYDPLRLGQLAGKQHEIELQIFDTINEAALRHDKQFRKTLDVYGDSLGLIPSLAIAHYKWVFGDKSQFDWLLAWIGKMATALITLRSPFLPTWTNGTKPFVHSSSAKPTSTKEKGAQRGKSCVEPLKSENSFTGLTVSTKPRRPLNQIGVPFCRHWNPEQEFFALKEGVRIPGNKNLLDKFHVDANSSQ